MLQKSMSSNHNMHADVLHELLQNDGPLDSRILPRHALHAAEMAFFGQLHEIKSGLDVRIDKALAPQRLQDAKEQHLGIFRCMGGAPLSFNATQEILQRRGFASPIYALAHSTKAPRLTIGATGDCKCQTPWNERSQWERLPYV